MGYNLRNMTEYMCIGPLTKLRYIGAICPCLLSEEDLQARKSYKKLSSMLSKRITYYKPPPKSQSENDNDNKSFLGSLAAGFLGGSSSNKSTSNATYDHWEKIESSINLTQGFRNSIAIEITLSKDLEKESESSEYSDEDEDSETIALQKNNHNNSIIIPFQKVGLINSANASSNVFGNSDNSSMIIIYGKQSQHNPSGKGDELLRFALNEKVNRVEFIDLIMNLIHWDRNRTKYMEDEEDTNNKDGGEKSEKDGAKDKKGFLKNKAEKAAYFAKRELEMQTLKREREQRKQKYLKDTGGLKYTAIAMANMEY